MSDSIARHPITLKRVVHRLPGMDEGRTERDLQYHQSDAGPLALDVYHPHQTDGAPAPVVLFGLGYRDVGVVSPMGCAFKEMEMFISMAQLVASSGMAAVTYTTSEPVADLRRVEGEIPDLGELDRRNHVPRGRGAVLQVAQADGRGGRPHLGRCSSRGVGSPQLRSPVPRRRSWFVGRDDRGTEDPRRSGTGSSTNSHARRRPARRPGLAVVRAPRPVVQSSVSCSWIVAHSKFVLALPWQTSRDVACQDQAVPASWSTNVRYFDSGTRGAGSVFLPLTGGT